MSLCVFTNNFSLDFHVKQKFNRYQETTMVLICIFKKIFNTLRKYWQYWIPCLVFCRPNCGPFVFATHRQKVTCWCITWDKNGGKTFNLFHILGLNMWKQFNSLFLCVVLAIIATVSIHAKNHFMRDWGNV